jgi:hypothetical protein
LRRTFDLIANRKAGLHIGHGLVMTLDDPAPGDQVRRLARLARLGNFRAHHHDPHVLALMDDLHGQIGDACRTVDAGHGADRAFGILVKA